MGQHTIELQITITCFASVSIVFAKRGSVSGSQLRLHCGVDDASRHPENEHCLPPMRESQCRRARSACRQNPDIRCAATLAGGSRRRACRNDRFAALSQSQSPRGLDAYGLGPVNPHRAATAHARHSAFAVRARYRNGFKIDRRSSCDPRLDRAVVSTVANLGHVSRSPSSLRLHWRREDGFAVRVKDFLNPLPGQAGHFAPKRASRRHPASRHPLEVRADGINARPPVPDENLQDLELLSAHRYHQSRKVISQPIGGPCLTILPGPWTN